MITKPAGTLVLLLAALGTTSAGCKEAKPLDTDTDTDTDTDDGVDTDEPEVTDGFPEYFAVERAHFGIDATTGQVIAVQQRDAGTGALVEMPITMVLRLTTHEVLTDLVEEGDPNGGETCRITLTHPGPLPTATWTTAAGAWLGFDMPSTNVSHDCDGLEFTQEAWSDDPIADVLQWTWGAGVNTLDPLAEEAVMNSMPADEWAALEPYIAGGGWRNEVIARELEDDVDEPASVFPEGYVSAGVTAAFELDAENTIVEYYGARDYLPVTDYDQAGLAPGYYEVQGLVHFTPASVLAAEQPADPYAAR